MRMIDDSFQNRISAEFAQMQAKLDAQSAVLARVLDVLMQLGGGEDDGEDDPPLQDLEGNPVPPDRPEGEPL